jgi:hypothetical protein
VTLGVGIGSGVPTEPEPEPDPDPEDTAAPISIVITAETVLPALSVKVTVTVYVPAVVAAPVNLIAGAVPAVDTPIDWNDTPSGSVETVTVPPDETKDNPTALELSTRSFS